MRQQILFLLKSSRPCFMSDAFDNKQTNLTYLLKHVSTTTKQSKFTSEIELQSPQ